MTAKHTLRTALLPLLFLLAASTGHAENPFVPTRKGLALEYLTKDAKGTVIIRSVQTVADLRESPRGTTITLRNEVTDAAGKPLTASDLAQTEETTATGDGAIRALRTPPHTPGSPAERSRRSGPPSACCGPPHVQALGRSLVGNMPPTLTSPLPGPNNALRPRR